MVNSVVTRGVERGVLQTWLDEQLAVKQFHDYAPNGLQVSGTPLIQCLVTGVTASQQLLDKAIEYDADAILVHHGYFWKGEEPNVVGMKRQRLKTLLQHDINLYAYHLPLDAHPVWGNNACLAERLGLTAEAGMDKQGVGSVGRINQVQPLQAFAEHIEQALDRKPLVIAAGSHPVSRVAWCSGGAQKYLMRAFELGADTYISGEVSENTYHEALELGVHYIAAGHHATERYGVQALGAAIAEQFNIQHHYVELDNPV